MKLLVFAHTPPPHHGQSYMVKLMLEGFGGDRRKAANGGSTRPGSESAIECYHVNCRYSDSHEDIGSLRLEKLWLVLRYCLEAIWCRIRYGVRALYYVPAPGKRAALYRDWIVMLLCRPFFPHVIHHWQAAGLGDWLNNDGTWLERWVTHRLLGRPTVGIALAIPNMRDPLWLVSQAVVDVPNGIPDPCPEFETLILPRRNLRRAERLRVLVESKSGPREPHLAEGDPQICRVLFLALCAREKGLFDTVEGVFALNEQLRNSGVLLQFHLTVAGAFVSPELEEEFHARVRSEPGVVSYAGFVRDDAKTDLLAAADIFCFPTYYAAEGQPVNLLEAISFGMPVVTTRWRGIPEILQPDYPGFVPSQSPLAIAKALLAAATEDGSHLRGDFLARYTLDSYLRKLEVTLCAVER